MRYRIEFLTETRSGGCVCNVRPPLDVELETARLQAYVWSRDVDGATGFRIRDLSDRGRVVALEDFDGPPPAIH